MSKILVSLTGAYRVHVRCILHARHTFKCPEYLKVKVYKDPHRPLARISPDSTVEIKSRDIVQRVQYDWDKLMVQRSRFPGKHKFPLHNWLYKVHVLHLAFMKY